MKRYKITNQVDFRNSFWANYPMDKRKGNQRQNDYCADTRMAFVDFVDMLRRDGQISEALAFRATL